MKRGIEKAKRETELFLDSISLNVGNTADEKMIRNMAMVATNYEEELSNLLTDFFVKIGPEGTHLVELNNKYENEFQQIQGIQILRGITSDGFFDKKTDSWALKSNPLVLTLNYEIRSLSDVLPILQYSHSQKRPLVIFCLGIEEDLLQQLVVSHQKKFYDVLVVDLTMKEIYSSQELLEDLSVVFNSTLLDEIQVKHLKGLSPSDLGAAHQIKQNFSELHIYSSLSKSRTH